MGMKKSDSKNIKKPVLPKKKFKKEADDDE
jgi:hypothetical protein